MRLSACACRAEHYRRCERTWWMKPVWTRRLYHCYSCDAVLFISPGQVAESLEQQRRMDRRRAHTAAGVRINESAGRRTTRQGKPA